MSEHICYLNRSDVRSLLIAQPDENLDITEAILHDIDKLQIHTAADIIGPVNQATEDAVALAFNGELCRQIDANEKTDSLSVTSKLVALPIVQNLLHGVAPQGMQPDWQPIRTAPKDGRDIEVRYLTDDPRLVRWSQSHHGTTWHLSKGIGPVIIEFEPTEWRDVGTRSAATSADHVAWIAFAGNGNIRIWTDDPARAEREKARGMDMRGFTLAELVALSAKSADTALLDTLKDQSWDLRCFDIPCGDDADIGWRVVGHWQARPQERTVGEVYHDDPRAAIREAIAADAQARNDRQNGEPRS